MPAFFEIDLGDERVAVSRVEVVEQAGHHQMARVRVQHLPTLKEGAPISIFWGRTTAREFLGYVNHKKPRPGNKATTDIICVGATRSLKTGQQKSWSATTLGGVMRDVARTFWLEADVDDDGYVSAISQPGNISTWEFLAKEVDKAGLMLVADRTRIAAVDPYARLRESWVEVPTYHANVSQSFGRVISFTGEVGVASAVGGIQPSTTMFGVDEAGRTFGAFQKGGQFHRYIDAGATTRAKAKVLLDREYRRERFAHEVEMKVSGYSPLKPGSGVALDGYTDDINGYWVVFKAVHAMTLTAYETTLTLRREEGTGFRPRTPGIRALALRTAGDGRSSQREPRSRLVNGIWRAA